MHSPLAFAHHATCENSLAHERCFRQRFNGQGPETPMPVRAVLRCCSHNAQAHHRVLSRRKEEAHRPRPLLDLRLT